MEPTFLATTDMAAVVKDAADWAESAEANRLYSMDEISSEIYGTNYDTEEFWRVVVHIGPAISQHGFKKVYWKNRRFWVKKVGADRTAPNLNSTTPDVA